MMTPLCALRALPAFVSLPSNGFIRSVRARAARDFNRRLIKIIPRITNDTEGGGGGEECVGVCCAAARALACNNALTRVHR